ncbi:hypothetical protein GP486_008964 [Trichoglossum hirsutum]|uniref:Uncharacterized protein n=1 Tax=Trichoglossum hirsutum TaxID=265104 RepID=A0A9P8I164_9PEZI|nr:hypothetical protein GP486_008964 [Trichoglossum hirsutum]
MAVTPGGFRFAQGGIITTPTMFQSAAGPVLGGEAGPEAIMPLSRGSDGKLGIKHNGADSGAGGVTQNKFESHVHYHGGTPQDPREQAKLTKQMNDQMKDMFATYVVQQQRRGGLFNPRTA